MKLSDKQSKLIQDALGKDYNNKKMIVVEKMFQVERHE